MGKVPLPGSELLQKENEKQDCRLAVNENKIKKFAVVLVAVGVLAVASLVTSFVALSKLSQVENSSRERTAELEAANSQLEAVVTRLGCRISPLTYSWYLAMNMNPDDGHIMDYTTGWSSTEGIGTEREALARDYKDQSVWEKPVDSIAIVRHQNGTVDAVKVFKFTDKGIPLSERFNTTKYYRATVTSGGSVDQIAEDAENMGDDPVFAVSGDLVFNWGYGLCGTRIALTGSTLSKDVDTGDGGGDRNTHGLGNHFSCTPTPDAEIESQTDTLKHEISNIQDCSFAAWQKDKCETVVQGGDHGTGSKYEFVPFRNGTVYGNYALYVSRDATLFPGPGTQLGLVIGQCD